MQRTVNLTGRVLKVISLHEQPNYYKYWLLRPIDERLETIEILRNQYI